MGRMAAWLLSRLCPAASKVALLLGSHRYLCQEQCEISFRSYLREAAPQFHVLETLVSLEDPQLAQNAALELLHQHPDLAGIYVAGGGIEGVIDALRDTPQAQLVTVCHDLTDITRQALLDGSVTAVLSHPLPAMARALCDAMQLALDSRSSPQRWQTLADAGRRWFRSSCSPLRTSSRLASRGWHSAAVIRPSDNPLRVYGPRSRQTSLGAHRNSERIAQ